MSDYKRIREAFDEAGLSCEVIRDNQYWKAIRIEHTCKKYAGPKSVKVEFWFSPDGILDSLSVEL